MLTMIFSTLLSLLPVVVDDGIHDAKSLISAIEAIQHPIEDFRCEFEGTFYFKGKAAEDPNTKKQIGPDGLQQAFDGVFTWKRGGDTRSDSMHRLASDGKIQHKILVVRPSRNESQLYTRYDDDRLGKTVIDPPQKGSSWTFDCYGWIFLIDQIKREVADEVNVLATVTDQEIDGHALKVLNLALKNVPGEILERYWINLRQGGHVIRHETYRKPEGSSKLHIASRLDITLDSFKLGNVEVWMPVNGVGLGYLTTDEKRHLVVSGQPTYSNSIKVVDRSMEFNKHPSAEVFTIKYKPGTPISDNLRKLTYEFGQQKLAPKPTKSELEAMLLKQVAYAEEQKTGLVAAPLSDAVNWSSWLSWGMGAAVMASSILLWIQRRS